MLKSVESLKSELVDLGAWRASLPTVALLLRQAGTSWLSLAPSPLYLRIAALVHAAQVGVLLNWGGSWLFGSCKDLQPSLLVNELCFDINATFIFGFF